MSHRQTRLERIAERSFPYRVCLAEEKCVGANFEKHREFCRVNGLALSRFGHSVVWQREWYQVFRFAMWRTRSGSCKSSVASRCIRQKEARASAGRNRRKVHTNRNGQTDNTSEADFVRPRRSSRACYLGNGSMRPWLSEAQRTGRAILGTKR